MWGPDAAPKPYSLVLPLGVVTSISLLEIPRSPLIGKIYGL